MKYPRTICSAVSILLANITSLWAGDLHLQTGQLLKNANLMVIRPNRVLVGFDGADGKREEREIPASELPECQAKKDALAKQKEVDDYVEKKAKAAAGSEQAFALAGAKLVIDQKLAPDLTQAGEYLKTHAFVAPEIAGVFYQMVAENGSATPKFNYVVNLTNYGAVEFKAPLTLTIIGAQHGTAFSKDFGVQKLAAGKTGSIKVDLFTGPSSVHGEACMKKWRLDSGGEAIGKGNVPDYFQDDVGN